jgi:hypothetical protein
VERRRRLGAGDHLIEVDVTGELPRARDGEVVVVVEPVYGVPAVAAALDAGWESVEVAGPDPDRRDPIPVVSFEQCPPAGATRCRVRAEDLAAVLGPLGEGDEAVWLGAPVNARPLASAVARATPSAVRLVACPATGGAMAADSWWAAGVLVRVLLEELDAVGDVELTDAAGLAVTLARGAEDVASQLASGARWRGHLASGGHADDLRVAAALDSIGVVPRVARHGASLVAHAGGSSPD